MRTIKELLQVMLQHKDLFETGMCYWVGTLDRQDIITGSEARALLKYIRCNRPYYFSWTNFINNYKSEGYFFPAGKLKPRIYWIEKHIKRLS